MLLYDKPYDLTTYLCCPHAGRQGVWHTVKAARLCECQP